MKFQRAQRALTIAFLATAVLAFGCKKDKGDEASGTEGGEKAGKVAEKAAAKSAGSSAPSMAVFPESSDFVFGMNGDSLRSSGLFKKFSPMIDESLAKEEDFQKFKTTCGFDPMKKVKSVVVAGSMSSDNGVVIIKGFGRGEAKECAEKMAKSEGEDVKIEESGELMSVTHDGKTMWFAWTGDNTVVTGSGAEGEGGKAWVEERVKGGAGLDKNKDMMALLEGVDTAGTMWFIAKPKNAGGMAMMGPPPSALFGTIMLTAGLKVDMGLRYGKADEAKAFVDQSKQMMTAMAQDPTTKMLAEKTKLEVKGNDAMVNVELNEEELNKVIAMVQQMAGPMLQGMLGGGM